MRIDQLVNELDRAAARARSDAERLDVYDAFWRRVPEAHLGFLERSKDSAAVCLANARAFPGGSGFEAGVLCQAAQDLLLASLKQASEELRNYGKRMVEFYAFGALISTHNSDLIRAEAEGSPRATERSMAITRQCVAAVS